MRFPTLHCLFAALEISGREREGERERERDIYICIHRDMSLSLSLSLPPYIHICTYVHACFSACVGVVRRSSFYHR